MRSAYQVKFPNVVPTSINAYNKYCLYVILNMVRELLAVVAGLHKTGLEQLTQRPKMENDTSTEKTNKTFVKTF